MKYRILKLSLINPGSVETNFALIRFKVDKEKAENVYKEFEPLIPDDVANAVYFCVILQLRLWRKVLFI
jgi:3-hydroxy acid dehydrogenase/malonic semialdehyde reductase